MPRVKLAGDTYRDRDLAELIHIYQRRAGLTGKKMSELLDISESTYYRWMRFPEIIPLKQLRMMQRKLNIPAGTFCKCLIEGGQL